MLQARDIHAHIGHRWPDILRQLGVPESILNKKGSPCPGPGCGGVDRFVFTNKLGRGDFLCRHCSPVIGGKQKFGDGFSLLQLVHGWDFKTARQRVMEAAGISERPLQPISRMISAEHQPQQSPSSPPSRVLRLRRETCALHDCDDAAEYLASRYLWPAAAASTLRAHVGVDYFDLGQKAGRYPALIADIRDADGELVSSHVTYLDAGRKLAGDAPRKILSTLYGHESCAVRLYAITGDSRGIGEGLETCIAAAAIHELPVWAALNTSLLTQFTPPAEIKRLVVFADRDVPGLTAATALLERLQGRVRVEIRTPPAPAKDWNDALMNNTTNGHIRNDQ